MSSDEAPLSHAGNVLGALTLALSDRMGEAVTDAADGPANAAAALSAMADFLDAPTVGRLRAVIGLTPSGTVRLVDGLEAAGLVTRVAGRDARSRHVTLTPAGARAAASVRAGRAAVMERALAVLTPAERDVLDGLLATVLVGLKRAPGALRWTCRLCDTDACGRAQGRCPFVADGASAGSTPSGSGGGLA